MRLRVVAYNVKGFRGGVDAAAATVGDPPPDLAFIQECGPSRRLRAFGRRMDMDVAAPHLFPFARTPRNAVMVRNPWRIVSSRLHRFERVRRLYPRGALVTQVGRAGYRVWALSVHLGLAPTERRGHAEELTTLTLTLGGPLLVGGDLNDVPGGKAATWIGERLWDVWAHAEEREGAPSTRQGETFPAEDPTARIDYLFVSGHFAIEGVEVHAGDAAAPASDHLPVVADLTLE